MKAGRFDDILNTPDGRAAVEFAKSQSPLLGTHFTLGNEQEMLKSRSGCEALLSELIGTNGSGKFRNPSGDIMTAKVPQREQQVKAVQEQFEREKTRCANEGRRVPDEMPRKMHEEYLRAVASLRIAELEAERVRTTLQIFVDEERQRSDSRVLLRGPVGVAQIAPTPGFPQGRVVIIDGQTVEPDAEGLMRICDDRSPYDGMKCADYIDYVVRPYGAECSRLRIEERERARKAGPGTSFRTNIRPPIPEWPDCVPKPETAPKKRRVAK